LAFGAIKRRRVTPARRRSRHRRTFVTGGARSNERTLHDSDKCGSGLSRIQARPGQASVSRQAVAQAVTALEEHEYVIRKPHPSDARALIIELAPGVVRRSA
jgi:hypothetical protein